MNLSNRFNTRSILEGFPLNEVAPVDEFRLIDKSGVSVLSVRGAIDMSNVERMRAIVEPVLARERIVIDLTRCEYVDSSAVEALWKLSRSSERRLKIVVTRESKIRAIFVIGSMMDILPFADTLDEAIRS